MEEGKGEGDKTIYSPLPLILSHQERGKCRNIIYFIALVVFLAMINRVIKAN